jgi:hypothetical protein
MPLQNHIKRLTQVFDKRYDIQSEQLKEGGLSLTVRLTGGAELINRTFSATQLENKLLVDLVIDDVQRELIQHQILADASECLDSVLAQPERYSEQYQAK